jgi:hypothetical protein
LLPLGTFGRGEMIFSISALSLALKATASAAAMSTTPKRRGEDFLNFLLYSHPLTLKKEVDDVS